MRKLFVHHITACVFIIMLLSSIIAVKPATVFAQQTAPLSPNPTYVKEGVLTIQGIEGILANILAVAVSGIGFAGFVMMIVGSFKYLLSGGNSKGVEEGRNTITYAIVGLVVALSSWIILNFIATFTGVEAIKTFNICFGGNC